MSEPRVWFGVLAAPLAWAALHVFGYAVSEASCDAGGRRWGIPSDTLTGIATGVAAVVCLAGFVVALGVMRATPDEHQPPPAGRRHMLGVVGVTISPLFLAIVLMGGIGALVLGECHQA